MSTTELGEPPRRLTRCEAVLMNRTSRIVLVLEQSYDPHNQFACLRTAESLGIQNVWIIVASRMRINKSESKVSKGKEEWLTIRYFNTTGECIKALREQNIEIWVTDLSLGAQSLEDTSITVPNRVAIVMGQEAEGASEEILAAADKKIYLPIYGFGESLNLSVATALVLQKVLYMCPEARGQMPEEERQELREKWYTRLARDDVNKQRDYKLWLQNPPLPVNDLRREEQFRIEFIPGKIRKRSERERNANNITNEEKSDNTDQV